jgi:hypothetical protein
VKQSPAIQFRSRYVTRNPDTALPTDAVNPLSPLRQKTNKGIYSHTPEKQPFKRSAYFTTVFPARYPKGVYPLSPPDRLPAPFRSAALRSQPDRRQP